MKIKGLDIILAKDGTLMADERRADQTSKYPKLTIYIEPAAKSRLEALSTLTGDPAWRIMNVAFEQYFSGIPEEDRSVIEVLTKRKREKELEARPPLSHAATA